MSKQPTDSKQGGGKPAPTSSDSNANRVTGLGTVTGKGGTTGKGGAGGGKQTKG